MKKISLLLSLFSVFALAQEVDPTTGLKIDKGFLRKLGIIARFVILQTLSCKPKTQEMSGLRQFDGYKKLKVCGSLTPKQRRSFWTILLRIIHKLPLHAEDLRLKKSFCHLELREGEGETSVKKDIFY